MPELLFNAATEAVLIDLAVILLVVVGVAAATGYLIRLGQWWGEIFRIVRLPLPAGVSAPATVELGETIQLDATANFDWDAPPPAAAAPPSTASAPAVDAPPARLRPGMARRALQERSPDQR
jgi:hypothetical protein